MKYLLVDIGSSNIKYMLDSEEVAHSFAFPKSVINDGLFFEVNQLIIFESIKKIVDELKPDRLYLSVQMHGYVLMKDGKEVTNYISWRDKRGKLVTNRSFNITKEYGVDIKDNLPRLKLELENTPEFDEFMTLGSYVAYKLTGVNKTHITDFASSGFLNVLKLEADKVAYKLPSFSNKVEAIGCYNNTTVYAPIGDHQLSILGSCYPICHKGYILNLGTAGQICTISDDFITGEYESRPYFEKKYLLTITNIPGGAYISEKEDSIELEDYLVKVYQESINKLPKRDDLLVIGGLLTVRKELIEKVLKRININYKVVLGFDALYGLKIISRGELE